MTHLPDQITQSAFYENAPAKRLFAWVLDAVIILGIWLIVLPFTGFLGIFFWATDVAGGWFCLPYN